MKKYITLFVFILFSANVFAQSAGAETEKEGKKTNLPQFSFGQDREDVLEAGDDIKKLILKYSEAADKDKPAVRKEIEQAETQNEQARIKKQEERVKRQEAKIKELRANLESRKKNAKQNISKRVDYLISPQSVEKVKNEPLSKKVIDKVKKK
jgi:predicted RNase H-like nuclease (RuvC/YqgF family)